MSANFGLKLCSPSNFSFSPHSKILEKWVTKPDSFEYRNGVSSFEDKEMARLFPDGELDKIYNDIAKDYGLENPPKLELINDFKYGDRGYYTATKNCIKVVSDFLKPEARKFLLEKDGQKFYTVGDSRGLFFRLKESDIKNEKISLENMGFKVTTEPLTDDDKRKVMIFLLAHELSHAYQNQVIRHTEGLNEWGMIEARLNNNRPKGMNLIQQKLDILTSKKEYEKTHSNMSFAKIYSKNSTEGQQAQIWYDATVGYKNHDMNYEENINNPLETNANERAYQYLKSHFGYFEGAIEF